MRQVRPSVLRLGFEVTLWQFFYGLATDTPSDVEPPAPDVFDPNGHQRYQKRLLDKAEAEAAEAQRIVTRDAAVFRAIGR